jgi:FkbM family methyltransferase
MALAQKNPDIELLYNFFKIARKNTNWRPRLAHLIESLSAKSHTRSTENYGECKIDEMKFLVDVRDRFGRACFYGTDQERYDLAIFSSLCSPGSVVWDVGANFGLYSILCAKQLGPDGRVFAVEPHRRALKLLYENIDLNDMRNRIEVFEGALSDQDGSAAFFESMETAFSGLSDTGRATLEDTSMVETLRLDSLRRKTGTRPIDLIKIDVEGHEAAVLEGALVALNASPNVIIQFEFSPKNLNKELETRLNKLLSTLEKEGWALWPSSADGKPLTRVFVDQIISQPTEFAGNIFLVRAGSAREQALLDAAANVSLKMHEPSIISETEVVNLLRILFKNSDEELISERHSRETLEYNIRHKVSFLEPDVRALKIAGNQQSIPRRWDQALQPARLSEVKSLTVILRVLTNDNSLAAALQRVPALCEDIPYKIVAVDARQIPDIPLEAFDTTLVAAPKTPEKNLSTRHWNRYATSLRIALAGLNTSHALLLDTQTLPPPRSVVMAIDLWRKKALTTGRPIAAIAFPMLADDANTGLPQLEEALGGMLALRHGIISCDAIQKTGLPADDMYAGDGFDLDLSLRLWHAGLDIEQAPMSTAIHARSFRRPSFRAEDENLLASQWMGIYAHPLLSEYFKPSGFRNASE